MVYFNDIVTSVRYIFQKKFKAPEINRSHDSKNDGKKSQNCHQSNEVCITFTVLSIHNINRNF
jgi:hypothetical protein